MSVHDAIVIGILVATFSALVGVVIGKSGKVTKEQCTEIRDGCNKLICNELNHIKKEQEEMKKDIKIILKSISIKS